MKKYKIFVCSWGDLFYDSLIGFFLPSLLGKGNIDCFDKKKDEGELILYLDKKNIEKIKKTRVFHNIEKNIKILIINIDEISDYKEHKYNTMTLCHKNFINSCDKGNIMIFLHPDVLVSENTFQAIIEIMKHKKALLVHGLRARLDQLMKNLSTIKTRDKISISPLKLLDTYQCYKHEYSQLRTWGGEGSTWPLELYFENKTNKSFVAIVNGLHPLAVEKTKEDVTFHTFDNDLIDKLLGEDVEKNSYFLKKSDSFLIVEFSMPTYKVGYNIKKLTPLYISYVHYNYMKDDSRDVCFSKNFHFMGSDKNKVDWGYLDKKADAIRKKIWYWKKLLKIGIFNRFLKFYYENIRKRKEPWKIEE
tara:strand:- start:14457 stop:15539 length:1083 start_codon:yes stop_codon:yes gene_type:complete